MNTNEEKFLVYFKKTENPGGRDFNVVAVTHSSNKDKEDFKRLEEDGCGIAIISSELGIAINLGKENLNNFEIKWVPSENEYKFVEKPKDNVPGFLIKTLFEIPTDNINADVIITRLGDGFQVKADDFVNEKSDRHGGVFDFFVTELHEPHIVFCQFQLTGKDLEVMETKYIEIDFDKIPERYSVFTFWNPFHSYELRYR